MIWIVFVEHYILKADYNYLSTNSIALNLCEQKYEYAVIEKNNLCVSSDYYADNTDSLDYISPYIPTNHRA